MSSSTEKLMRNAWFLVGLLAMVATPGRSAPAGTEATLPPPAVIIPEMPPLQPQFVTAGGRRLLLNHDPGIRVWWDAEADELRSNRPGWYLINFPLDRIEGLDGLSEAERTERILGHAPEAVRNWYMISGGEAVDEPDEPTGPAPIDVSPRPGVFVDALHADADDGNPGTADAPLRTIQAAIDRADPGMVIRVRPGIYRERLRFNISGTREAPIVIEGERDAEGHLPLVSFNQPVPREDWEVVSGMDGVYRAPLSNRRMGTVLANSHDGQRMVTAAMDNLRGMGTVLAEDRRALREVGDLDELEPGTVFFDWSGETFLQQVSRMRREFVETGICPAQANHWRTVHADDEGRIDFGEIFGESARNAVILGVAHLYRTSETGGMGGVHLRRLDLRGGFRGARDPSISLPSTNLNRFRLWVNQTQFRSAANVTFDDHESYYDPRHWLSWQRVGDLLMYFSLPDPGWHTLSFVWDTTTHPESLDFRFPLPTQPAVTAESHPARDDSFREGAVSHPYIALYRLSEPIPSKSEPMVYVWIEDDIHPADAGVSLPAHQAGRSGLVDVGTWSRGQDIDRRVNYVHVRGLRFEGGSHGFRGWTLTLNGAGNLVEGCQFGANDGMSISVQHMGGLAASPTVIRNNWILDPGVAGINSGNRNDLLTAENQDHEAPGRGRILVEHNIVRYANRFHACEYGQEAGGMKFFRLTGGVIRYNEIDDNPSQGIWLDGHFYNNRLEGNRFSRIMGYGVGIEFSQGANVVANNLVADFKPIFPAKGFARYGIVAWNSARTYALNNTIDGRWDQTPAFGNTVGVDGIWVSRGPRVRPRPPWAPFEGPNAYVNNLVTGCAVAVEPRMDEDDNLDAAYYDIVEANFTCRGQKAQPLGDDLEFFDPERLDYRVPAHSEVHRSGVRSLFVEGLEDHVYRYDFYGLLRFPEDGMGVGAFRAWPTELSGTQIEIDLYDGSMERR